jgi:hypothetical protein
LTDPLRSLAFAAALIAAAPVSLPAQPGPSRARILDVPYLPQSEALCGGAAIAMVMRYWGVTGVYAETFAALVDPQENGIRGEDLLRALRDRGFEAQSVSGDERLVRTALAERQPPILLIEDRPGRFHYVVVVGWFGSSVVLHDPARAPYRVLDTATLQRAWQKSDYWTLLAAAPAGGAPQAPLPDRSATDADAGIAPGDTEPAAVDGSAVCSGIVSAGVRLAQLDDREGARRVLEAAATACPGDPAPLREMAGLHALEREWKAAATLARRALRADPADAHAARILATSLFIEGDLGGALDAWNRLGEPLVELVEIHGLRRTQYAVGVSALGVQPQTLLTREVLARAGRRMRAIPSLLASRVTYRPLQGGRAVLSAAAVERPAVARGSVALSAVALRTAIEREVAVITGSLLHNGESWQASWRWWERRPRIAAGLSAPAPFGGVWAVQFVAERQAYGPAESRVDERRRFVALSASDWLPGGTRWEARASVERWGAGVGSTVSAGLDQVLFTDRLTLHGSGTLLAGAIRSWVTDSGIEWRSGTSNNGSVWSARAGITHAGERAPFALWPGAGTGQGRDALLRAHRLLADGAVSGGVFGRTLAHGGVEWRLWHPRPVKTIRFAPAVFVDVAHASHTPAFADPRAHTDVGIGLRAATPFTGVLRVDLARGLRDGEMALSFGWTR